MERTDLRKVLAGFGLATLLAGVALSGCTSGQKSS
jgi:radical SAM modification target selenobiotic family peptide